MNLTVMSSYGFVQGIKIQYEILFSLNIVGDVLLISGEPGIYPLVFY